MSRHIMNKFLYVFSAVSLLLTSCIDDASSTAFMELPNVSIAMDDAVHFDLGVEGEYAPTIDWGGTSPSDYDYLWTINGKTEISREQVLKHTFTESGEIYLTFQMTDKNTQLVFSQNFKTTVTPTFFLGWVILSENADGSSALSFIHFTTRELYPDIYKTLYPDNPLGSAPYRLEFHSIPSADQILVMQRGGDGLVELDGENFRKVIRTEEEFIGEQYPEEEGGFDVIQAVYTHRGPDFLLTKNGHIYDRLSTPTGSTAVFQAAHYSTEPFTHREGEAKFTYLPFPANSFQFMFDNLNKRWLGYYNTTPSGTPHAIPKFLKSAKWSSDLQFDYCEGMNRDVDLIFASTYNENSGKGSLLNIFKQSGVYYVAQADFSLSLSTYSVTVDNPQEYEFAPSEPLDDHSLFCLLRGTKTDYTADPHLFYNVGKKVFFFHAATQRHYLFKDFSKGENAPSGDLVGMMQCGDAKQMGFAFSDGHFYICNTEKALLTDIRNSNVDPEISDRIELAHITDIPGTIKYAIFKYGKRDNFINGENKY